MYLTYPFDCAVGLSIRRIREPFAGLTELSLTELADLSLVYRTNPFPRLVGLSPV